MGSEKLLKVLEQETKAIKILIQGGNSRSAWQKKKKITKGNLEVNEIENFHFVLSITDRLGQIM